VRQLRRRRVQLLGGGSVGGRAEGGRIRQRRRAHVHLAHAASCANDNILAAGQTMLENGTAGASKLGLLESSSNGATSGPITITYTDGTSTTQTVSSSDWAKGPGASETAVATMSYRNRTTGGPQTITMYVYATTVPIDSSKTVASITFPYISNVVKSTSAMHVFAVTTG
jgi:hypothetical protein